VVRASSAVRSSTRAACSSHRPITEPAERRAVLTRILSKLGRPASDLPACEARSPLVAVTFDA
jgi:hypothetical protein